MKAVWGALCLVVLGCGGPNAQQARQDEAPLRALPQAFSAAFNKHDGHALAAIMAEDLDFVTVGLTWLHGRADFEKYHTRLLDGRFKEITRTVLETHVQFVRPDVAVVRHSWTIQGDKNVDGSARPQRFGLMTMVADKRNGVWVVAACKTRTGPPMRPQRARLRRTTSSRQSSCRDQSSRI
jgi:uncharacterized protein (TIGR02246 family)